MHVICGPGVETRDEWFCEATWDSYFGNGDFDLTDIVAGTGGRLREGTVIFVSSSSIQDRLQSLEVDGRTLVSNSMSAIAALSGVKIDPTRHTYEEIFATLYDGLEEYDRDFPTDKGIARFTYYENLVWDGSSLSDLQKPRIHRDFSSYQPYTDFMVSTMRAVIANATDESRNIRFDPLVTLSSGYDSPAVAAIAANAGVTRGITIALDRDGADDSGEEIGRILGYDVLVFGREHWQRLPMPEIDGIAASCNSAEVSFTSMTEHLQNGLLLSGFWGGLIWRKQQYDLRPTFHGNDGAGVSWTEMRLSVPFINCAVPYWGGAQLADVVGISNQAEMDPWSIGGWYDRPIPRRLLETAGVPRNAFGQRKQGVSEHVLGAARFLSPASSDDYEKWLRENRSAWLKKGKVPPIPVLGKAFDWLAMQIYSPACRKLIFPVLRRLSMLPAMGFINKLTTLLRKNLKKLTYHPMHYRRHTFPWAFERAQEKYKI